MPPKLGLLAGGGVLPRRLAEAARDAGRDVFIIAFKDQTLPETVAGFDHAWVRLGAAGKTLRALHQAGCRDLVMAGGIRRPSLSELRPDWRGLALFVRAGLALRGDDGALRAVRAELEGEGFRVIAAQDVMATLLMPPGILGMIAPTAEARDDIRRGLDVLAALAPVDVGQAVVVQQGLVLGVEAIEGTAALLQRAGSLRREGRGGVLVKCSKPGQDTSFDLPTIGPETVEQAFAAGLAGLAVEAGRALLLEQAETVTRCNARGLFLLGLEGQPSCQPL